MQFVSRVNRLALLAAVVSVAVAALAFSAQRASAFDAHGCPASYGCGWVDGSFGGARTPEGNGAFANQVTALSIYGQSTCQTGNWSDCISSVVNAGTVCTDFWFQNNNFGGWDVGFVPQDARASISNNDAYSSMRFCTG